MSKVIASSCFLILLLELLEFLRLNRLVSEKLIELVQLKLLQGVSNRRTGATSVNAESSRSHSVFTCVVESRCKVIQSYVLSNNNLNSFKCQVMRCLLFIIVSMLRVCMQKFAGVISYLVVMEIWEFLLFGLF